MERRNAHARHRRRVLEVGGVQGKPLVTLPKLRHKACVRGAFPKTGKPRWRNAAGSVEKAYDVNRIGASSQQRAVWYRGVDTTAAENLERFLAQRIEQVIEAAK